MTANIRAVVEDVVKSMLGNGLGAQQKQNADVGSIIRAVLQSQGVYKCTMHTDILFRNKFKQYVQFYLILKIYLLTRLFKICGLNNNRH